MAYVNELGVGRLISPIGRTATFTVAASDSSQASIDAADYQCDGTADDVEINAALAVATTTGLHVMLSEGNFIIAAPIMVSSRFHLSGQGGYTTTITLANNSNCNMIESDANIDRGIIEDIGLVGNKANQTSGHGIYSGHSDDGDFYFNDLTINRVNIGSCKENGIHRAGAQASNWRILNSTIGSNDGHGIYSSALSGGLWIDNCYSLSNTLDALNILTANDVWITNSSFDQSRYGFAAGNIGNGFVNNCYFGANSSIGVYLSGTFILFHFDNNEVFQNTSGTHGGFVTAGNWTNCYVTNNTFYDNTTKGVWLTGGTWTDCQIVGNIATGNGGDDFDIDATLVRTKVLDNIGLEGYGSSGTATFTVAAFNSNNPGIADYVCDGTADEVQIQAAIDALPAVGGRVVLSEGTFTIASPILLPDSAYINIALRGQGISATTLKLAVGANCDVIKKTTAAAVGRNVTLEEFLIDGNSTNNTSGKGIDGTSLSAVRVKNVYITGCAEEGLYADGSTAATTGWWLLFLHVYGCGLVGTPKNNIHLISGANNFNFISPYSQKSTQDGFYCYGCTEIQAYNVGFDQNTRYGARLESGYFIGLRGGYIGANEDHGLLLSNGLSKSHVTDICFNDNGYEDTADKFDIYMTSAGTVNDCVITGNIFNQTYGGMRIGGDVNRNIITGNNFSNVGTTTVAGTITGSGNKIHGNIGYSGSSGDVVTISKVIDHASLTDNADATAYMAFDDTIPAGSIVKAVKLDFTEAWNSDNTTTLTIMVGVAGDLDGFSDTADPGENAFNHTTDLFWGEANCQDAVIIAAEAPRVTFTEDNDATHIISGAGAQGAVTVTITYMKA